mgnify:CR=1 FL=1
MFREQKFISNEIKSIMRKDNLIPLFLYTGIYNYHAVDSHLVTLKQYLKSHIDKKKTVKESYNILVECLENINHHGLSFKTEDDSDSIYGYLIFASEPNRYSVWAGNFVAANDFLKLKDSLDEIINTNNEELKSLYRQKLGNNDLSEKQGMGIGLIDIVLKSKEPIAYVAKQIDDDTYFFSLEITIQK